MVRTGAKRGAPLARNGGGSDSNPLAAELQSVKAKLAEAEATIAAGSGGAELSALKAENASLRAQLVEKDAEITRLSDELDSTAAAAAFAASTNFAPPPQPTVNAPTMKGKKSVKKGGTCAGTLRSDQMLAGTSSALAFAPGRVAKLAQSGPDLSARRL